MLSTFTRRAARRCSRWRPQCLLPTCFRATIQTNNIGELPQQKIDRNAWTEEEIREMMTLLDNGVARKDIARQLGKTYKSVQRELLKQRIPNTCASNSIKLWTKAEEEHLQKLAQTGHTKSYIAQSLGRSRTSVYKHLQDLITSKGNTDLLKRGRLTRVEIDSISSMRQAGLSKSSIACSLNRPINYIEREWRKKSAWKTRPLVPFVPEEDEKLSTLRASGLTWLQVAANFPSRKPWTLRKRLAIINSRHSLGRLMQWTSHDEYLLRTLWEVEKLPTNNIAEKLGRSADAVDARADFLGLKARIPRWTADEDKQLVALRSEGLLYKDIAKRLGRTTGGIKYRFYKLRNRP